ncbi:hypothetical protein BIU98_16785 [Curtobacterium sp. MMLR14_010]|uniref:hypothetical protein n=1 Tax=Curtobacterium sp. MMLR14_010 TaxID=1898743 RepID=UPI0008DDA47E|nr:hypothetical protein [Curtobacterium sp. MMLR14_010]OII37108.1 hypothetical protein BIU98_16785 [Curtobacterium sp. MMLR14_010]
MDKSTQARCRQRGCVHYGLWHSVTDSAHRAKTLHTALAAVTIEKSTEDGPWMVWIAPHGEAKVGPLLAPPQPTQGIPHEEWMELRSAVLYALRSAKQFSA